jgi:hypothetical protein
MHHVPVPAPRRLHRSPVVRALLLRSRAPTFALVALCSLLSAPRSASAQADGNTLDPTEPTTVGPAFELPTSAAKEEPTPAASTAADASADTATAGENEEVSVPGDPWGDLGSEGLLSLRALLQFRYVSTYARASENPRDSYAVREEYLVQQGDGYSFNRLFVRVGSDPSPYLGFKAVFDFAQLIDNDPEDVVKQAYANFRIIPEHLELVVGMFKLPFSTIELDASSRFETTNFGASNSLASDLGFAGRDLGIQVLAAPFKKAKRLRISLGAFRGRSNDEHDSPIGAVAARVETKPNKHLRFGADMVQHTKSVTYNRPFNTSNSDVLPNPPNPLYPTAEHWGKGRAFSVDARYKQKGFMLRAEALYGDRVDLDERYGARTFWAAWGLAAYRIDLGAVQLLPAVRYEWFDADREHDTGIQVQFTGALTLLFLERVRVVLDVTATDVQTGSPLLNQRKPLQAEPYLALDNVRGTLQLQLEL